MWRCTHVSQGVQCVGWQDPAQVGAHAREARSHDGANELRRPEVALGHVFSITANSMRIDKIYMAIGMNLLHNVHVCVLDVCCARRIGLLGNFGHDG